MRLVNRTLPPSDAVDEVQLFAPEGSAEGCASGDCTPAPLELTPPPARSPASELDRWRGAVAAMTTTSARHGASLSHARFLGFTDEGVRLGFGADAGFHRATVLGSSRKLVEDTLSAHLGRPMRLLEETDRALIDSAPRSLAAVESEERAAREQSVEARVRAHPAVQGVVKLLGGSIEHIRVLEAAAPDAEAPLAAPDDDG